MSSSIYNSSNPLAEIFAIRLRVQDLKGLARFVQEQMSAQNISTHEVAKRSGNAISHGTVWNIANQQVKDVKPSTLTALAKGLRVSEDDILGAVGGKQTQDERAVGLVNKILSLPEETIGILEIQINALYRQLSTRNPASEQKPKSKRIKGATPQEQGINTRRQANNK